MEESTGILKLRAAVTKRDGQMRAVGILLTGTIIASLFAQGAFGQEASAKGLVQEIPIRYPRVIVSEVFTGVVVRVVDERTLVIRRDGRRRAESVTLFGLTSEPTNTRAIRAYLGDHLRQAPVRVEGRSRMTSGVLDAIVTVLPRPRPTFIRPLDPTGASNDQPFGVAAVSPPVTRPDGSLNAAILRLGLARVDARLGAEEKDLLSAQAEAQKNHAGTWAGAAVGAGSPEKL